MSEGRDKKHPPRPPPPRGSPAPESAVQRAVASAETAPPFPDSAPGLIRSQPGLKLVTVVNASIPDLESSQVTRLPTAENQKDPYLGATIDGRYKVEAVLGEGGMGVVYRCTHTIIGKKVAMKVLRADLARDKEVTERFLNEARSASAIGNQHIIDISDFGLLPDGSTYFVMEFLEGLPLTSLVEGGKAVPVSRLIHIARQLAEGLAAAHQAGIVHRDLKPDNIFVVERGTEKDFVKILDFGIAKVSTHTEGRLTRAGAVFGTPHYMSPEQAAGAPVDHRGDIYSYGVILYELASGKVPFDADNFMGILTQHMYKAPVPIRALVPAPQDVPPGLEAVVLKCLSKRPEQRYASMEELIADLDKVVAGAIPAAVPEMMNRSGGFNVPADYFKKGAGMPAPMPAAPLEIGVVRSRWPLYAGIAGVLAAVLIVVGIFAAGSKSDASTAKGVAPTTSAPPGAEKSAAPPTTASEAPSVPQKQVAIAVEPLDAHVFDGDEDLGESPVVLKLDPGEKKEVELRRTGFISQKVTVDDSKDKLSIKMVKKRGYRYVPPVKKPTPTTKSTTTKPKPKGIGGDTIINPWE
jgi:tRNA A-37 threonylcarbamoyl transferase component Bud32